MIYAEDTSELERKVAPFESDESFAATSLNFANATELPDLESDLVGDIEMSDDEIDAYWQMADDFCERRSENKILGHSDNIQGGMELECELVTNGFYCDDDEDYSEPEFEKMRQNIGEWTLLLQIGSNDENEMMWCDCGKIYLWIEKVIYARGSLIRAGWCCSVIKFAVMAFKFAATVGFVSLNLSLRRLNLPPRWVCGLKF